MNTQILKVNGLTMDFGGIRALNSLDLDVNRGDIVALIGPNGAGKTTLFRMITGQEKSDSGIFRIGETVQLAYVDQSRELDPQKSVWQEINGSQEFL